MSSAPAVRPVPARRRAVALLAVLTALLLAVGTPSAMAKVKPVLPRDVPKVAEVASVYPKLRGGTRDESPNRAVRAPRKNCVGSTRLLRSGSGRTAFYAARTDPARWANVGVSVHRFEKVARSRAVLQRLERRYTRCEGTHDGGAVSIEIVPMPSIGGSSFGFRQTNGADLRTIGMVVQKSKRVVIVSTTMVERRPGRGDLVDLVRIATQD